MDPKPPIIGLFIILCVFITRYYYHFNEYSKGGDSFDHYIFADEIRKAGHRIPTVPDSFVTGGGYHYPYLMHWALSYSPYEYQKVEQYFSAVMDVIICFVVISLYPLGFLSLNQILLGLGVVLATPQLMRPDLSHGIGISARKPGLILVSVSLLSFIFWMEAGRVVPLVFAFVVGGLIFLTSKFSVQAYTLIIFGLIIGISPVFGLLFILSLTFAVILSKGRYLKILESHLRHLYVYATYVQYRIERTKPQNPIKEISAFLQDISKIRSIDDLRTALGMNNVTYALLNNPHAVFSSIGLLFSYRGIGGDYSPVVIIWLLSGIVAYILTSLPYFRFLGQSERYLEYVLVPSLIIISTFTTQASVQGTILYPIFFSVGVIVIFVYLYNYSNQSHQLSIRVSDLDDVIDYLNEMDGEIVLCQPRHRSSKIAWQSNLKVVEFSLNAGCYWGYFNELRNLLPETMTEITDDVEWLDDTYNPDWVVFEKNREYPENTLTPPDESPIFENNHYLVYRFERLC